MEKLCIFSCVQKGIKKETKNTAWDCLWQLKFCLSDFATQILPFKLNHFDACLDQDRDFVSGWADGWEHPTFCQDNHHEQAVFWTTRVWRSCLKDQDAGRDGPNLGTKAGSFASKSCLIIATKNYISRTGAFQ